MTEMTEIDWAKADGAPYRGLAHRVPGHDTEHHRRHRCAVAGHAHAPLGPYSDGGFIGHYSADPRPRISNSLRASLVSWSKTLSDEVASDGVTANILMPGRIDTERVRITDKATAQRQNISVDEVAKRSFETIPMRRYGRVEELAAAATFVLSERASYMTGSIIRVDGGIVRTP